MRELEGWDVLIDMDKRSGCAYTIDALQRLMGEDAFRKMFIRQHQGFITHCAYASSQIEGKEHSFMVVETLE